MAEIRRERRRRSKFTSGSDDAKTITQRVVDFFNEDIADRAPAREERVQRYAKYRQWTEGNNWPWEGSSDVAMPDITISTLSTIDSLVNAVLANRPVVQSEAVTSGNRRKQETIDHLLDYQFFIEQCGEEVLQEMSECFVLDGDLTSFVPWIREERKSVSTRMFPPIPDAESPEGYFQKIIAQLFPQSNYFRAEKKDGWDWRVEVTVPDQADGPKKRDIMVSFYTTADRVEMTAEEMVRVYDGPRVIVKNWEDVLYPVRAANLQPPGPSNPNGASHVILVETPTIDEIQRLHSSGFYNLLTAKELVELENYARDTSDEEEKKQKDVMEGKSEKRSDVPRDTTHRTLTMMVCFDLYDVDNDGINEDMIWWVLYEPRLLVKAKRLSEMYPMTPPRRPFGEASYLPVKGRKMGISFLELMEGLHDWMKQTVDQMMDAGTMANSPFGFYRPTSNLKQETIRPWPGELYPLSDPKNDVVFPTMGDRSQAFGLNVITLINQLEERLSMRGDLQLGRVPSGKAAALRTSTNMALVQSAGEARPQRVLRRFFTGLTDVFSIMHELNRRLLPETKKIRVASVLEPGDDPYREVQRQRDVDGDYTFSFKASILNSTRQAQEQGLNTMLPLIVNPVSLQLGLTSATEIYKLIRDIGATRGVDAEKYMKAPTAEAEGVQITWEEAVVAIMNGARPDGAPMEGAIAHLQALTQFAQSPQFGYLDPSQTRLFAAYVQQIQRLARQEQANQQLLQNAAELGKRQLTAGAGGASGQPPDNSTFLESNELADETLPSAGGGGAQ